MRGPERFTSRVREELAHLEIGDDEDRLAEVAAALRTAGTLRLRGGGGGAEGVLRVREGAVARRLRATLVEVLATRPDLTVARPGNLAGSGGVELTVGMGDLVRLGLRDAEGRRSEGLGPVAAARPPAAVRGALMVAGSFSAPGRPPHGEIRTGSRSVTRQLVGWIAGARDGGDRVVLKSGDAVGELLATVGAHGAFLDWDAARLRRELRGQANRVANADRANLRRTAAAASAQIEAIRTLVDHVGLEGLPSDLRDVALARLVNPEASLAELASLLTPPVGRATVHRRLGRLMALAEEVDR